MTWMFGARLAQRRTARRRLLVTGATLLAAGSAAAPANAGTAQIKQDASWCGSSACVLEYRAGAGETNQVTVEPVPCALAGCSTGARQVLLSDAVPVTPGAGCESAGPTAAICTFASSPCQPTNLVCGGGVNADLYLGDGADSARTPASGSALLRVDAGSGDDLVEAQGMLWADGGPGDDRLLLTVRHLDFGLSGTGRLTGGDGDDVLAVAALAGNNVLLDGGAGADRIDGGIADYSSRTVPVTVTPDGIANDGAAGERDDIGANIRGAEGGSAGDTLAAGAITGMIWGHGGDDHLIGGPDGDQLFPGDGTDTVSGGGDDDWIMADEAADTADVVDCGEGTDEITADYFDALERCESVRREPLNETVAPSSRITSLPATVTAPATVSFEYSDPEPSSGIGSVAVYVKEPGATTYALSGYGDVASRTYSWTPTKDGEHALYTIAIDNNGNREAAPSQPDASTSVDLTAPAVTSYTPTGSKVNPATKVTVTFSEQMDRASAQQAFRLTRPDGSPVTGSFGWNGTTMTFAPAAKLARKTSYQARVATTAKDLAGRALEAERTWSFTTS